MSVTVKVNGTNKSLVHKGSTGIVKSTMPDVCKTPSPAGPVPIPYPIIVSMSSDLANGTTTVKADGKMVAVKGCEFTMCTGDEPGTAGGVVSSTFKKEAKFILYSFDVKLDGKNGCRFGDKLTMNHQNSMCLSGLVQFPVTVQGTKAQLEELAERCNRSVNRKHGKCPPNSPKGEDCTTLGTEKHKCCEEAIQREKAKGNLSNMEPEVPYNNTGQWLQNVNDSAARSAADTAYGAFISSHAPSGAAGAITKAKALARKTKVWFSAYKSAGGAVSLRADVVTLKDPTKGPSKSNIDEIYDFKFNCNKTGKMSAAQRLKYRLLLGKKPKIIHRDGRKC